jgi:hypothetical protein
MTSGTFTGATTPARSARADLLLRARVSPHSRVGECCDDPTGLERRPQRRPSSRGQESRTSASITVWPATRAAVIRWRPSRTWRKLPARVRRTGGASRPSSSQARYSSIFTRSRPQPRRRMSASGTHVVVSDAACATRLPSGGRFECGRVESNHHSNVRRGYSALSSPVLGVRRVERGRPVGLEPTLRGSRPRMLAVTSRPPRDTEGGIGSPQPGAETLPSDGPGASCFTFRQSCQRDSHAATPHRSALGACRPSCTLGPALCPALVPSLPRPPVDGRSCRLRGWDSNPRSRAHEAREDNRSSTAR